jgi:hypothetical protein
VDDPAAVLIRAVPGSPILFFLFLWVRYNNLRPATNHTPSFPLLVGFFFLPLLPSPVLIRYALLVLACYIKKAFALLQRRSIQQLHSSVLSVQPLPVIPAPVLPDPSLKDQTGKRCSKLLRSQPNKRDVPTLLYLLGTFSRPCHSTGKEPNGVYP